MSANVIIIIIIIIIIIVVVVVVVVTINIINGHKCVQNSSFVCPCGLWLNELILLDSYLYWY